MASIYRLIERRLDKQVSALGLGVFRIAYGCVLFLEVAQLFYFRHYFFDPIPYISPRATDLSPGFLLWLGAIACLIAGLFTRAAAVVSYVCTIVSLSRFSIYEYHNDYILISMNFLLMFLPVGRRLSVDRLIEKRLSSPAGTRDTVSVLAYEVPVFLGIALVYLDSSIYKIFSPMWSAGLGLWQPASAPYATLFDWSWLLDQESLVKGLGFLVIAFEAVFILLMWFRWARVPLLIVGLGFHLGILLIFALPLFALSMVSLFLLLVPVGCWENLAVRLSRRPAVSIPERVRIDSDRSKNAAGLLVTAFLALVVASQVLCALESPPLVRRTEPVRETRLYKLWREGSRTFLGIHPHPVFMDWRYGPYPKQFAVVYLDEKGRQIWLPVVSPRGHSSFYSTGRQQVYWTHRVNGDVLRRDRMEPGVRRLTAFWAHQNDVDLRDAEFHILVRELKQPRGWESGLLHRQCAQPWVNAGTARWSNGHFILNVNGMDERSG